MGASFGLTHATVLTMDDQMTVCEAVFVEEGKIKACGTNQEITALCRERKVKVLGLQGNTVLPGFHDCHLHMMNTGRNYSGIDMYDCASVDDVLDKVREAAATYPQDHWIYGKRLDESRLREKRPPTAAELDQVAPRHPVYISDRGLHYTLVNTAGFELLGLSPELPGVCKSPDGGFNGRLHEKANSLAKRAFLDKQSYAQREAAFRAVAKRATEVGITTLHTVEGGDLFSDSDIPVIMDVTPQLPVDVLLYWCTEDINKIKEAGLPRQGGDFLLDGSIGSRTAAFKQPYADAPDTHGFLYYADDRVEELIMAAHLANVQISFHVIGELAITQALDAFERVLSKYPKADHRHRLEHFGFPLPGEIERAARLGIAIVTQPAFMYLRGGPGSVYNERLGDERASGAYPLRKFLDAGLLVGGGSDSDVTPMDPLFGIHAAVNQPYPESSISVIEALRMYTIDGARTAFEEERKGSLEVGKLADFVVLAQNPLEVPQSDLKDIEVVMTMKEGGVTYQK